MAGTKKTSKKNTIVAVDDVESQGGTFVDASASSNDTTQTSTTLSSGQLKVVGLASIFASLSFIIGFALFTTVLADIVNGDLSNEERFQSLKDNERIYYLSNMVLYILFGIAQLILTVGLTIQHKSTDVASSLTLSFIKSMGIIWCVLVISAGMIGNIGVKTSLEFASTEDGMNLWIVTRTLHSSLGGSNEIVGGIWVLLASWYQYRSSATTRSTIFDKIILCLGVLAGLAGIVSTIPVLSDAGAGFGVCMILWYLFTGIQLIRSNPPTSS